MSVFDLKQGDTAKISRIDISGGARVRLNSLGIKEGETVQILSFSLFKSSVLIACSAVRVGIRKSLAQKIEVQK